MTLERRRFGRLDAAGVSGAAPAPALDVAAEHGPGAGPAAGTLAASRLFDPHGMQPDVVLAVLDMLGETGPARILVVGCEPASVDSGMDLSKPVANAVDEAVQLVLDLVAEAGRDHESAVGTPAHAPEPTDKGVSHVPWHSR